MRLVVVLGGLASFGPLSMDMYLPGLPQLGRALDASASATQLTLTACLVGLALGQLVAGPLSDRFGRRRPLIVGVALYATASLLCSMAPSIGVLIVLRLVQGLAGSAGIVITRAVVSDLYRGAAAARAFSSLMLVNGLAPVLAPVVGAQLLALMTWHGIFVVLGAIGCVLLVATVGAVPESLPAERRRPGGLRAVARTAVRVGRDRAFDGYALCGGLVMGAMFAYIAGSPFVLQDLYHLSPQAFSAVFAGNGLSIVAASAVNGRLIGRVAPQTLLRVAVGMSSSGAAVLLVAVLAGAGVVPVLVALVLVVSCVGIVLPNTVALALAEHGEVAGTASALIGVLQYLIGALAAPVVGVAGSGTAVPMAVVIVAMAVGAALALRMAARVTRAV